MTRQQIHKQVIEHFGVVAQLKKTVEEIQELLDEICSSHVIREDVLSELADVRNMTEQLPDIIYKIAIDFGLNESEIEEKQDYKMLRTKKIIEKMGE